MSFDAYNDYTDPSLSDSDLVFHSSSLSPLSHSSDITKLNYDERIQLFQMLSKSVLFCHQNVKAKDIAYWFPECISSESVCESTIPRSHVNNSLECIVAQLMEQDL